MNFNSCVLLYSKYSTASKKLMEYINTSGVDLTKTIGLQLLCVDNNEIRKKIIKNNQLTILTIPCILLIYKDGGVEKYEGLNVFNWCEEIINQLIYKEPNKQVIEPEQKIEKENEKEEEEEEEKKPVIVIKKKKKNKKNIDFLTNIDDLLEENNQSIDNKESQPATKEKNIEIMNKAKEMAKGREEEIIPPPVGYRG